jgi:proteic killer suppression protein
MLNAASAALDLKSPPGNRLETLKDDLRGLYSIRVNDQWRVVFRWEAGNAHDVRLTDYHK